MMARFSPAGPDNASNNGLIRTRVCFTRHLYAMLVSQKYLADKRCPWPADRLTDREDIMGFKLVGVSIERFSN